MLWEGSWFEEDPPKDTTSFSQSFLYSRSFLLWKTAELLQEKKYSKNGELFKIGNFEILFKNELRSPFSVIKELARLGNSQTSFEDNQSKSLSVRLTIQL